MKIKELMFLSFVATSSSVFGMQPQTEAFKCHLKNGASLVCALDSVYSEFVLYGEPLRTPEHKLERLKLGFEILQNLIEIKESPQLISDFLICLHKLYDSFIPEMFDVLKAIIEANSSRESRAVCDILPQTKIFLKKWNELIPFKTILDSILSEFELYGEPCYGLNAYEYKLECLKLGGKILQNLRGINASAFAINNLLLYLRSLSDEFRFGIADVLNGKIAKLSDEVRAISAPETQVTLYDSFDPLYHCKDGEYTTSGSNCCAEIALLVFYCALTTSIMFSLIQQVH